jgi:hypothetical protein
MKRPAMTGRSFFALRTQLPQTAEALAAVDNSVTSVATRAECIITFAILFIFLFPSWVEASTEDVNVFSMEGLVDEVGGFRVIVSVSF